MARARFVTWTGESDGDVLANKLVTLYNSDGTNFTGNVYAAASGGSPLTADQIRSNSVGVIEYYTDEANAKYIQYAVESVSGGNRNGAFDVDPAQVVTLTGTQTLTNKTLTSPTLSAPALTGSGTFVNLAGTGTFSALGVSAGGWGGIKVFSDGTVAFGPPAVANSNYKIQTSATLSGAGQIMLSDMTYTGSGHDDGNLNLVVREGVSQGTQISGGPASNLRALEINAILGGLNATILAGNLTDTHRHGLDIGISSQSVKSGSTPGVAQQVAGIYVMAQGTGLYDAVTGSTNGVRINSHVFLGGADGSEYFLYGANTVGNACIYAVDQYGAVGAGTLPAAMFHALRNMTFLGANVPVSIVEGDNTGTVANQFRIRGATATTKRLTLGYDTTSNWGTVDADSNGTGSPLLLNPTGGSVYASATTANGGAAGRLVVKQLADDVNSGLAVARAGSSAQRYLSVWIDGNGANLQSVSPGVSNTLLRIGAITSDIAAYVNAPAAQSGDLLRLDINSSEMFSVTAAGNVEIGGNKVLSTRGAAVAAVASANATDLPTAITLVNEIKAQLNTFMSRFRVTGGHGAIAD